jgi:hypothetical protein
MDDDCTSGHEHFFDWFDRVCAEAVPGFPPRPTDAEVDAEAERIRRQDREHPWIIIPVNARGEPTGDLECWQQAEGAEATASFTFKEARADLFSRRNDVIAALWCVIDQQVMARLRSGQVWAVEVTEGDDRRSIPPQWWWGRAAERFVIDRDVSALSGSAFQAGSGDRAPQGGRCRVFVASVAGLGQPIDLKRPRPDHDEGAPPGFEPFAKWLHREGCRLIADRWPELPTDDDIEDQMALMLAEPGRPFASSPPTWSDFGEKNGPADVPAHIQCQCQSAAYREARAILFQDRAEKIADLLPALWDTVIAELIDGSPEVFVLKDDDGLVSVSKGYWAGDKAKTSLTRGTHEAGRLFVREAPPVLAAAGSRRDDPANAGGSGQSAGQEAQGTSDEVAKRLEGDGPVSKALRFMEKAGQEADFQAIPKEKWKEILEGQGIQLSNTQFDGVWMLASELGLIKKCAGAPQKDKQAKRTKGR